MLARARANLWFWLGHTLSRVPFCYRWYNLCMYRSLLVNDRYGLDLWSPPQAQEHREGA